METSRTLSEKSIAVPADFPVTWLHPEDPTYHWTRDREHNPKPITPMFNSLAALTAGPGRKRTVELYAESILERQDRIINTYNYTRLVPFQGSDDELARRMQLNRKIMLAIIQQLDEIWEAEWRPELEAHWRFWQQFDLETADLHSLAAHLKESIERVTRIYEIHYLMGPPMWFAIDEFEKNYCDLFPGSTALDAHRLLQGFDNKTLESGRSLWRLSRLAMGYPPLRNAIESERGPELLNDFRHDPLARAFLAAYDEFLVTFGRRSDLWDWGYQSWEDDPTPVINAIRLYMRQPERDLEAELARSAEQRAAAVATARQALACYPQPVIDSFESLLRAAQCALVLTENHTYYIDFNGFGWMHRLILEFGKRFFTQGRLLRPDDVFYITIDELHGLIADRELRLGDLAASRRRAAEQWAQVDEPVELGTRPAEPVFVYSPDGRRMLRYIGGYGTEAALQPQPHDGLLHGEAGSSGKVRGPARLIRNLAEAHRLQPGDILVTETTAPPWTPLFLTAVALVTDAGGLLSHGAVVAREYHLPAVVGTKIATAIISDGQWIEVDGDTGLVRILE